MTKTLRVAIPLNRVLCRINYFGGDPSSQIIRPNAESFLSDLLLDDHELILITKFKNLERIPGMASLLGYFSRIIFYDPLDFFENIPGHSWHFFLDVEILEVDCLVHPSAKKFQKYAKIVDPQNVKSYIEVESFYPELYQRPNEFQIRFFGENNMKSFIDKSKEREYNVFDSLYQKIKVLDESNKITAKA